LWGAVPMDETLPISHAAGGQRSLDILLGWCEKDAACRGKFPDPRGDFKKVMARLDQGPVTVEIKDPATGKPTAVQVSKTVMIDGIRWTLYNARTGAMLPLFFHEAANGNFLPLAEASVFSRVAMVRELSLGLLFSVTCAEDVQYIDPATVPARTAGSFLGDDRVRQQMGACSVWPRAKPAPGHQEAVRSDVPILIVNGERDPVTPPEFGKRVARSYPNALPVVIPYGGHSGHDPCVDEVEIQLVQKGTTKGLDISCVAKIPLEPFLLELPRPGEGPFG
ncbi:MAG TPA: alpha/beta hydrolase, partial [Thermoanaerobaculia bacterium]